MTPGGILLGMKTPVSVVVITKNEEENIADCLSSASWADEIILVDDESSDRTLEIARRFTDKIFQRRMDNEGRHRNWAYTQARNDWVLSLDADERVTPELAEEVAKLLQGKPPFKAYGIPRRNYIGNYWLRYGGEYPAPQVRLFLKKEFKYEEAEVHPRALMEGATGYLRGDILHYSHRDLSDYLRSLNGHTTLEAKKWYLSGKKISLGRAVWRAVQRTFLTRLLRKKGYKDGVYGLAVAYFSGVYQIVSWLKYRELVEKNGPAKNGPPA